MFAYYGGRMARVSFGNFSLSLSASELNPTGAEIRLVSPGGGGPKPLPARPVGQDSPVFRPGNDERPLDDVIAIEAFRLGLVPTSQIEQWTFGREAELETIRAFLHDRTEGAVLIEGSYGAGKSHLLRFLARDAERSGFAVAMAGFDPSEAAAAFPSNTWRKLVQSFHVKLDGVEHDFREFLKELVARPAWRNSLGGHPLLGRFLERLEANRVDEEDFEWIEGRRSGESLHYPTLHGYTTCANIYCNLLSAISRAAAEVLGLEGLLVLLDEAEVARSVRYRYQEDRGINFFRGLTLTANDEPVLLEEEFEKDEVLTGVASGLVYSGHCPIRYTSGIPAHLKVAFALTPGPLVNSFRAARETIQIVELELLSVNDLKAIFTKICDRFQAVFGVRVSHADRNRLFSYLLSSDGVNSTRDFIKATVESLDYLRFYPHGSVENLMANAR